jgi:signal transduction histidine kinase
VINDLLDLTKLDDSDMLMHEEPFSLCEVMLKVVGAYAAEAERKGLTILFNIESIFSVKQVIGDPQRLRQSVSNILSNSLAHSDHGAIVVEVYPVKANCPVLPEDTLTISIRDEGDTMSEQQLNKIFLQLENILDEEEEISDEESSKASIQKVSIGLGIAVVARFVHNSSGQIKIETMVGRGTRVSL